MASKAAVVPARALVVATLLLGLPRASGAVDRYAELKPLVGTWLVDLGCTGSREKILAVFMRQPNKMFVELRSLGVSGGVLGTADIVYNVEDHYRVSVSLPGNPILARLGLSELPGHLIVSDDPDEPDSPGKDYLTCGLDASVFHSMTTIKLRSRSRRATYIFNDASPIGKDQCRGTAVKQKSPPKATAPR